MDSKTKRVVIEKRSFAGDLMLATLSAVIGGFVVSKIKESREEAQNAERAEADLLD